MATKTETATRTRGRHPKAKVWKSRAVQRNVEAGSSAICTHCDEQVKFAAREKRQQVICNVYKKGIWDRVEHYHEECYTLAGQPYGEPGD